MYRWVALLGLLAPAGLLGQVPVTVAPQECVWRAGDNPAWAAQNLDETGWQPYALWKLNPNEPRIWVRCHADLSTIRGAPHPAIQVSLLGAYRLYVNGVPAGGAGNIQSGNFRMNTIRSFPLPSIAPGPATIAVRITLRMSGVLPASRTEQPIELTLGAESALHAQRAGLLLARSAPHLVSAVCFGAAGILGVIAFGLFLIDPSRRDFLLLAIFSVALAGIYIEYLLAAALFDFSSFVYVAVWSGLAVVLAIARPVFFFAVARRRVPLFFWIAIGLSIPLLFLVGICAFLPPAQALWCDTFLVRYVGWPGDMASIVASAAPFYVFWPYTRINRRIWPLAALCCLLSVTLMAFFFVRASALHRIPGVPDLAARWGDAVSETEGLVVLCTTSALFGILFRDHRQVAEERAILAGEMQAAREIQQMIAPAAIDAGPGLRVGAAFHPVREVGGDFYQVIRRRGDSTLVVIGDVSGKGLRAAMTGTLAVGALRTLASEELEPSALLTRLNREMAQTQSEGFITCLCVLISPTGEMAVANAGHLAPYHNGDELAVEPGLPLGVVADASYTEARFTLAAGDTLTLLSDGVVEAQSKTGELFGFERAQAISTQPAEEIAAAAQAFGQQDDVTVLTLQFAPAGALAG